MKKIGFFILFLPALDAYWSGGNAVVDTPLDLSIIKATRVTQGINDLNHGQVLILLLVTLIFVVLFGLAFFFIVRRLIRIGRAYRQLVSSVQTDEPDVNWRKAEEPDFSMQIFTEQQWLLNQLLSQSHEDGDAHDFVDFPHDWWS